MSSKHSGEQASANSRAFGKRYYELNAALREREYGPYMFNGLTHKDFQMNTIDKVRIFHKTFEHPVSDALTVSDAAHRMLRIKLIAEELGELVRASGCCIVLGVDAKKAEDTDYLEVLDRSDTVAPDIVEMADALGDLDYVVQGANLVFGIPAEAVLDEIQRSNMSKAGPDGRPIKREDGKILKGPDYFRPDIAKVLGLS